MGVKGLSKAVIKHVWRDGALGDLPAGTRIGVDAAGWLHKACVSNAQGPRQGGHLPRGRTPSIRCGIQFFYQPPTLAPMMMPSLNELDAAQKCMHIFQSV